MKSYDVRASNDILNEIRFGFDFICLCPAPVMAIQNQNIVTRQDDERVGLLVDKGIRDVVDAKGDDEDRHEELATFIDTNLAVNMLTTTAKKINHEFQSRVGNVMSRFGEFKAGPTKTVERCQS